MSWSITGRPYNTTVRLHNWDEDITLQEDTLKDFNEQREQGELLCQKSKVFKDKCLRKVDLSVSRDGYVHFEDVITLVNPVPKDRTRKAGQVCVRMTSYDQYYRHDLMQGPCHVSLVHTIDPTYRSAWIIKSFDGSPPGETLRYGQAFYLKAFGGELYLKSQRANLLQDAEKSRHHEIKLVPELNHWTEWKVVAYDPAIRVELESRPVPANQKVLILNLKTNECLCVETACHLRTLFGWEKEVTSHTALDSHRAEMDCNHFMMSCQLPGDDAFMPMEPLPDERHF